MEIDSSEGSGLSFVHAEQGDAVVVVITGHVTTAGAIHREFAMAASHRSSATYVAQVDAGHRVAGRRG